MISAVCVVPPNVSIITEYESTGDLLYVLSNPDIDLDATLAIRIAEGICEGMLFLHSRNACHYNLKSRNVIVK